MMLIMWLKVKNVTDFFFYLKDFWSNFNESLSDLTFYLSEKTLLGLKEYTVWQDIKTDDQYHKIL